MSRGYLLVHVEGARYGLPLGPVLQVDHLGEVLEVPREEEAEVALVFRRYGLTTEQIAIFLR